VIVFGEMHAPEIQAQSRPAAPPAFDVASIKPSKTAGLPYSNGDPGTFSARNFTLKRLIEYAYRVQGNQISNAPGWADSDEFDVEAKAEGLASWERKMPMLQTLLATRFQLKVHLETRQSPSYVLEVEERPEG
jgi:uncharacterized protein (TIGR03435 family)